MLVLDLEATLNQVLFPTPDIATNLFLTVLKVRSCPWHYIEKKFYYLFSNPYEYKCTHVLQCFSGACCTVVQIHYFLFAWAGKSKVMIVIIATRLLANVLPTTTLLTLRGLNTWEKSIKRKSNIYPQCEPGLGESSVSPAYTGKKGIFFPNS